MSDTGMLKLGLHNISFAAWMQKNVLLQTAIHIFTNKFFLLKTSLEMLSSYITAYEYLNFGMGNKCGPKDQGPGNHGDPIYYIPHSVYSFPYL